MANFRIRIAINRRRGPVDYQGLASLTQEIDRFLRYLGEDAGLSEDENKWVASEIRDGSFISTGRPGSVSNLEGTSDHIVKLGLLANAIVSGDAKRAQEFGARERTRLQYARLSKKSEGLFPVEFGIYKSDKARSPKWYAVTQARAAVLTDSAHPYVDFDGALQGVIHSWFKESDSPHFQLREVGRNELVKCYYSQSMYPEILRALIHKDELIHVRGVLRADRLDRSIESVKVRQIKRPDPFSDDDFERFFGCAPELTGEMTSADFVAGIRGDGD